MRASGLRAAVVCERVSSGVQPSAGRNGGARTFVDLLSVKEQSLNVALLPVLSRRSAPPCYARRGGAAVAVRVSKVVARERRCAAERGAGGLARRDVTYACLVALEFHVARVEGAAVVDHQRAAVVGLAVAQRQPTQREGAAALDVEEPPCSARVQHSRSLPRTCECERLAGAFHLACPGERARSEIDRGAIGHVVDICGQV